MWGETSRTVEKCNIRRTVRVPDKCSAFEMNIRVVGGLLSAAALSGTALSGCVVESLFYMWRATKDPRYRDIAWNIFESHMKYQRVESGGFACSTALSSPVPNQVDQQQSFFIAETLKYLYLIFSPDSVLDLRRWVLNTEAHPLPRKRWVAHFVGI